jgi:hypothetical protein
MSCEISPDDNVPVITQKLSFTPRFVKGMPALEGAAIELEIPGINSVDIPCA